MKAAYSYTPGDNLYIPGAYTVDRISPGAYTLAITGSGPALRAHPLVHDDLFILDNPVHSLLFSEIEKFWNSKEKYQEFGVLYKRGILTHGPHGVGKTAALTILMEEVIKRGGIVILYEQGDQNLLKQILPKIREIEPELPILIIVEDVDYVIEYEEEQLLSLMDGETQTENVVWLLNTNHIEKLPPRLINRPSRVDLIVEVLLPTENDRLRYLNLKIGNRLPAEEIQKWATETEGFSIAHLKELMISVLCLDCQYEEAKTRIRGMVETEPKSGEDEVSSPPLGAGASEDFAVHAINS